MNILFIGHEKDLNGASLSLLGIIDELIDENDIYVLTNYFDGNFVEELNKRNVKIIKKDYRRWMITKPKSNLKWIIKRMLNQVICIKNYFIAKSLKKIIVDNKIDIIHTNSSVINIGGILQGLTGVKHIWHIREFGEEDFNMHFVYSKNKSIKFINDHSEGQIAVSYAIKDKYKNDLHNIDVIYNGINANNFQERKFNYSKDNYFSLLISGRVEEAKGQKDAIYAIGELVKRGYKNIKLLVAGNGKIEEMKKLCAKLQLSDKVVFLGRVDKLKEIRRNIDIELVCSRNEAFGRVTIEAMMSMLPVIGANTGGTKELIKNNYNGLLYKQGDCLDLADKIEILINDTDKIEEMGKNAMEFAKRFTSKENAKKIYELYNKVLMEGKD